MARTHETEAHQILEAAYGQKTSRPEGTDNPVVLSCGGIFIPQPGHRPLQYHVLNTANEETPAKVVSGAIPRNMLQLVMTKESMN